MNNYAILFIFIAKRAQLRGTSIHWSIIVLKPNMKNRTKPEVIITTLDSEM